MNGELESKDKVKRRSRINYREAALKAWRTIRKKELEKAARSTPKLESFLTINSMASITHPEDLSPLKPMKKEKYRDTVIRPFSKTPPDIACGFFWELRWAFGCPFECSYCYLRGTYKGDMKLRYLKIEHVLRALEDVFQDPNFNNGKPAIFNSGELTDSLINPAFMDAITDYFDYQDKHKLLLLSKCGSKNVEFLVKKYKMNVVCAWSINAVKVAKQYESKAPQPEDRIEAARLVFDAGYPVWIRIDPIFPIEDWKIHYEHLLYRIFRKIEPGRIILGTPRGLRKTLYYTRKMGVNTSWTKFFNNGEKTGWGLKLNPEIRREIYLFMRDKLKEFGFDEEKISICKESYTLLNSINWKYKAGECQCYGSHVFKYLK